VLKTLAYGIVDQPYSETLEALGPGPVTWTLESGSLPDGLSLSPSGEITGTPILVAWTKNFETFVVKATNSVGSSLATFSIDVFKVGTTNSVTPGSTGTPLPEGSAIAMVSYPGSIWYHPTTYQYLASGEVKEVGLLHPAWVAVLGPGPTKPQPASDGGMSSNALTWSYARIPTMMTSTMTGQTVDLWSGNPIAKNLVHTYTPPVTPYEYVQAKISPDASTVAVVVSEYPNTATRVYFYSTSAPFQSLRPPVTLPKAVVNFIWSDSSEWLGVNLGATFGAPPGQEPEFVLLSPTDPQADLAPSAYQDCRLSGFLASDRLAALCGVSLFFNLVGPYIVTGTLDGSSVRTVLDWTGSQKCWSSAGSPSGQYLALTCTDAFAGPNRLAYIRDEPMNPANQPVILTAAPPGSVSTSEFPLEWSNDPWPYIP
jgi:hypothetical protein